MPSAQLYAGITEGLSNVAQYERERPLREARLAEAKARQAKSEFDFEQAQSKAPIQQSQAQLELEQTRAELATMRAQNLKRDTFSTFDAYEADGDARHLNSFLTTAKQNPQGQMWQNWVRFDPMTRNPETEAMLAQAGIRDIDGYFADPELVKSKVIGTDANGKHTLLDMNKLYQATGYTQHMGTRELNSLMQRAQIDQLERGTQSAETNMITQIAEQENISQLEAAKRYFGAKQAGRTTGSAQERIARDLMSKDETLSYEAALKQASRLSAAPSTAEKDIGVTAGVREQIHEAAGGDFYTADLAKPETRERIGELIIDLEKATGKSLTNETKRVARDLRSMIQLGGKAGEELTEEETGIMDNMLFNFKKYVSDNVEGTEGTAAYSAMRNVARNALMGATLTPKELSEFDKAAGTLKQQLGPVLAQLKVQLEDFRGKLQSVMDFEDPMMAKYYLGMSQDQADAAIDQIDKRLTVISDYTKDKEVERPELETKVSPVPKPKKSAAERFKELRSGS